MSMTAGDLIGAGGSTDTQHLLAGDPLPGTMNAPAPATSAQGMDASFEQRLNALIAASGGRLGITSGYRSTELQQKLWDAAVKKYGSETAARKWVAPPGHSNHEKGMAADLHGDIGLAHRLAPQFGLVFPMSWEDWHIEPAGLRSNPNAYTQSPPGFPDPGDPHAPVSTTQHLAALVAGIHLNPEDQQAIKDQPATGTTPAGVAAPAGGTPIAAPTAPTPVQPQATDTAAVIGSPSVSGDTQKLIQGDPITDSAPSVEDVNAAAGAVGVVGNASGVGHIKSTPERESFAQAVLAKAGLPSTPENMRALIAWQQGEGTAAAFNPFATTTHAPGSTAFNDNNGTPVQNFTSFEQGVDATVKTLFNGHYGNIIAALQSGTSAVAVAQAIANSPWGTGRLVLQILGAA